MKIYFKDTEVFVQDLSRKGYSLRAFAKIIGVTGPYMSELTRQVKNPGPATARKIANALEVPFDHYFYIQNAYKSNHGSA